MIHFRHFNLDAKSFVAMPFQAKIIWRQIIYDLEDVDDNVPLTSSLELRNVESSEAVPIVPM